MRKIYFILFLILLLLIQTAVFAEDTAYTDKKNGFSIDYPSDYRTLKDYSGAAMVILFPKKDFSFYNDNIAISVIKAAASTDRTPEEITDIYFKYSKSVLEQGKISINGIDFLSAVQTQKTFFLNLKQYHLIAVKGLKVYKLTYTAAVNNYDKSLDTAKRIMYSFKFID